MKLQCIKRMITIRKYRVQDMESAMNIWNEVVRDGIAFPQDEELTEQNADSFFNSQDEQRCRTTSFWTTAAMWLSIQSFRSISVPINHLCWPYGERTIRRSFQLEPMPSNATSPMLRYTSFPAVTLLLKVTTRRLLN